MWASQISIWVPFGMSETEVEDRCQEQGIVLSLSVSIHAGEFESFTPYLCTYEDEDEPDDDVVDRGIILGNGPNRIGQEL